MSISDTHKPLRNLKDNHIYMNSNTYKLLANTVAMQEAIFLGLEIITDDNGKLVPIEEYDERDTYTLTWKRMENL